MPAHLTHAFFIEGGALADRERAQDRVRLEGAPQPGEGNPGRRRASRSSTSARPSTAAAATRCRSRTPIRSRPTTSRSSPGRASTNPKLRFPVTAEVRARRGGGRAAGARADPSARSRDNPDDIAAIIIEPIQAEGGDNHFRPEFLQHAAALCHEHDCLFIVDEVQTGIGLTGRMWAHEHFGLSRTCSAFGKKTQVCGCLAGPRVDEEPRERLQASARASTRPGAAGSPTWCASRATSRSSTRSAWSTTRAWSASACCAAWTRSRPDRTD